VEGSGDSATVINSLLQDTFSKYSCCQPLYHDIRVSLNKIIGRRASHIWREGKQLVDWLVKKTMRDKGVGFILLIWWCAL